MIFSNIALISRNIKVLIIGGGRAALIKTKAFLKRGCKVSVCSLNFLDEFCNLENEHLNLINSLYDKKMINDKHFIVIAIDDDKVIEEIINECELQCKLYVNCKDFKEGNCIIPYQIESNTVNVAINTKEGNPKISKMISSNIISMLEEKDEFISFINNVRKQLKGYKQKNEILDYLISSEFQKEFQRGNIEKKLKEVYRSFGLNMED